MDSINEISCYLNKCYTLSNTSQMTTFSFRKTAHRCIVCVAQSNWVKMLWFSRFPVLPGSAEAQVTWGGTVKRRLIAYIIGNISAKKYQNPFMCVKDIASQRWDVFKTRCSNATKTLGIAGLYRGPSGRDCRECPPNVIDITDVAYIM